MKRKIHSFYEWQNYLEVYHNYVSDEFRDLLASWESEREKDNKNKVSEILQLYGLYESNNGPYENVYYLITEYGDNSVIGLLFDKETLELSSAFNLTTGINSSTGITFKKVDNVFMGAKRFKLKLVEKEIKWEGWNKKDRQMEEEIEAQFGHEFSHKPLSRSDQKRRIK
jgi:hypothetical protein